MPEERVEAKISFGSLRYFVREGTPREGQNALVVGPRRPSDTVQHHLTVVSDLETGEIDNVHLTSVKRGERRKKWQLIPREMEPSIARWIKDNSSPVIGSDIRGLRTNYYCVSGWRVLTAFRIAEGMLDHLFTLLARPLIGLGVVRIKKETVGSSRLRVSGQLNVTRTIALARKLRPFKRIFELVLPVVVKGGGRRLVRLFLIQPERMSSGDVSVLIPKGPAYPALVLVKWGEHRQIDLSHLIGQSQELYRNLELKEVIPDLGGLTSQTPSLFEFDVRKRLGR